MWRKFRRALPAIFLMAVVYYADSWVLALPIIGVTAWLGGFTALTLIPLYLAFDYMLGRLTLRLVVEEKKVKDYGLLMRFMRRWFNSFRDAIPKLEKQLSSRSKLYLRVVGFAFASYYGGAFVTTPVMYSLGQRRFLRILSAVSAAIYAVTFVVQVALGTSVVLWVIHHLAHWL